jgi:hypothetical protein
MNRKVVIILLLVFVLYAGYLFYTGQGERFMNLSPAPDAEVSQPPPTLPDRVITAAGPNPPSQQKQEDEDEPPVRIPGPQHRDPYADNYQTSSFGDDNRAPERMFGPSPQPEQTEISRAAGITSNVLSPYAPAVQQFNPEGPANGGEFISGGVFANDTDTPTNFSAF